MTNNTKGILGIALPLFIAIVGGLILNRPVEEEVVINDMLLYEHDNSDFYIEVSFEQADFDGVSSDKLILQIVNSRTFNTKHEPDPIYCSTEKEIEIEYSSLPVKEVTDELAVTRDAPTSNIPWAPDFRKHDLFILDNEYFLFQYLEDEYSLVGPRWWKGIYENDRETQGKLIEHADYDQIMRYQFGPRYHVTPEGQLQCIYKYGNCVYYRQVN